MEGEWLLEKVNNSIVYECPEVLTFNRNDKYVVLNDCHGDIKYPKVEEGIWWYDESNKSIFLSNRNKFYVNEFFMNNISGLILKVRELNKKKLVVEVLKKGQYSIWTFKRFK
ncbi:hypothetical protein GCM10023331_05740 [Algivirga pacifica]|uniref:Lipocalin-like domain-containing protein n=1 Tax=Algivirga pacifica TaxID=1162670 RepID=A0ABP9D4C5_9BACT